MRKCFLGGLNFETTEEDLREYFGKYGDITDAVVIRDKITKKSRGFGFVTFKTLASTDKVIQDGRENAQPGAKSGHNIKGRDIECKRAISREVSHLYNRGVTFPAFARNSWLHEVQISAFLCPF